jgi:hypothetical protein
LRPAPMYLGSSPKVVYTGDTGFMFSLVSYVTLVVCSGTLFAQTDRSAYLDGLVLPHRYSPGKNSFVVQHIPHGQKATLLELTGSGSVRHIWSTWRVEPGQDATKARQVLFRVYLDGELQPAIQGSVDEVFWAAEAVHTKGVPLPVFNFNRSFNLYLPLYFRSAIRIEAEPTVDMAELYFQIDYRQTERPESPARLVSHNTPDGVRLKFVDGEPEAPSHRQGESVANRETSVQTGDEGVTIPGPGIIRKMTLQGEGLDDLELLIYWDGEASPSVRSPLRYFFGGFKNAGVESEPGRLTAWFPMPFLGQARVVLRGAEARKVSLSYALEKPATFSHDLLYFHARFREEASTVGYSPYVALQTEGAGHFVGVNLFDTGHDHGGGDTALIDAGSESPRVLHGVCGEDYFGLAWFDTGPMTPLAGAPVQERRYRLHLENPYSFKESLRFTFGTFAGRHPKSVAFWYQAPGAIKNGEWKAADVPWNVLGPLAEKTAMPDRVDDAAYKTEVPFYQPFGYEARWQPTRMDHGFLDLTHHFRRYIMTREGTGYVVGRGTIRLITYVHSDETQSLETLFGHDEAMTISLNGKPMGSYETIAGFRASRCVLPLQAGWNKLMVTTENDENNNWRWWGMSMAVKDGAQIRFAAKEE